MIDQTWAEIRETIEELSGVDDQHIIRHLLPVVQLLERTDLERRVTKYVSMFCLICKVKDGDQALDFPFVSLMPPAEIYSGTSDEFFLSVYDRAANGEERQLIRERFYSAEIDIIVKRLCQLVVQIEKGDLHL